MFNRVWATPVSACDRSLVDRQLSLLCIRHVEVDARSELSLQAHLSLYRHRWSLKPVSYRRLRQVTYVGLTPRELNVCTKGDSVWSIYDSLHLYVTQDRTHLTRTAAKMKSRNNLISKLADNSGCKYHLHVSSGPLQIAIHFCAPPPPSYARRRLLCFHSVLYRCPDVSCQHRRFWTYFNEMWGVNTDYHQQLNWLHFGRNCTRDKGAGYDRKFESTSNRRCYVANDFTDFTHPRGWWVHYTHAAAEASYGRAWSLALRFS